MPSSHTQEDYQLRAVFLNVACGPPASDSPEVLIKFKDPPSTPEAGQRPVFRWLSRGLKPPRFEKPGPKGLELPTTPIPKDPCLGQGCTGPLGGWYQLVGSGVESVAQQLWTGGLAPGQYWGK